MIRFLSLICAHSACYDFNAWIDDHRHELPLNNLQAWRRIFKLGGYKHKLPPLIGIGSMHLLKLRWPIQRRLFFQIHFLKDGSTIRQFLANSSKNVILPQEPFQRHISFFLVIRILKMIVNILNCEFNFRWTNEYEKLSYDRAILHILIM